MEEFDLEKLLEDDRRHLLHPLHHPKDHVNPHVWVRGEGAVVWDARGREYLDGLSGLWNIHVGHGRIELAEAAAAQMRTLAYYTGYVGSTNIPAIQLAERLSQLAYPRLNTVFFTTGGAESNETAFKTSRFYWKAKNKPDKVKVISRWQGYHGVTLAAMSATGIEPFWKRFEPRLPGFHHVPSPYSYRFSGARQGESVGLAAARMLEEAIVREGADTVGAFLAEPVQGAGGVIVPPADYFPKVREICSRYDVLFIADEVITGFGRTGRWFGLSHWDVEPDIMTFAKGITSGYLPLGGMMVSDEIAATLNSVAPEDRWMHSLTYSCHPTCCAVALKNLDIIEREGLVERAEAMGKRLLAGLRTLESLEIVGEVRGLGLMAGVELVEDRASRKPFDPKLKVGDILRRALEDQGLFTRSRNDVILLAPPLIIRQEQVDRIIDMLRTSIQAVRERLASPLQSGQRQDP